MVGPYWYFTYRHGRLVAVRTYRDLRQKYGNEKYKYIGKKRLVRPRCKKGLHRFSRPWKHYQPYSTTPRQFKPPLSCGYSSNQLWVGLCRAWNAFTIRKQKNDMDGMQFYGRIIHKLQKKLELLPTEFDIYIGDEYDDDEENDDKDDDSSSYEGHGYYDDDDGDGDDNNADNGSIHDSSSKDSSRSAISDEELLEIAEKPIYYSGY